METFVVAAGDPFEGLTLYGPFPSLEAAENWADDCVLNNWTITEIKPAVELSKQRFSESESEDDDAVCHHGLSAWLCAHPVTHYPTHDMEMRGEYF